MASYGGTGTLTGNAYGDLSAADAFTFQKRMLPIAKKLLTFQRFAQKETKPQKEGLEIRWRRYNKFALNTNPISEGVTPDFDQVSHETLRATLKQYGGWVPITDVLQAVAQDPVLQQITEKQAIQAAEVLDTLTFDIAKAGTYKGVAGPDTTAARTTVEYTIGLSIGKTDSNYGGASAYQSPSTTLIDTAIPALEAEDANKLNTMVLPSPDYNTTPIRPSYVAVGHTDLRQDVEALPDFIPVEKYSGQSGTHEGEIGSCHGVRFILTTMASSFADAGHADGVTQKLKSTTETVADVYPVIIFAQDAMGCVSLSGKDSLRSKVVLPKPSSTDPIGQRGSSAWDTFYVCKRLDEKFLYRLEVGCSSLA